MHIRKQVSKSNFRQCGQMKSTGGKSQRREEKRREEERRGEKRKEDQRREKGQKKEDASARKRKRSSESPRFCNDLWLRGSKSRLDKAAGAEASGQIGMKSYTPLWNEARFDVKMYIQNTSCSDDFWNFERSKKCTPFLCEARFELKMYTSTSEHFWKLSCRKRAPRCGAKLISE